MRQVTLESGVIHAGTLIHFSKLVWVLYWEVALYRGQNPSQTGLSSAGPPVAIPVQMIPHTASVCSAGLEPPCLPGCCQLIREVVSEKIQGYFHLVNRKHGAALPTVCCSLFRLFISTLLKCECNPRPLN